MLITRADGKSAETVSQGLQKKLTSSMTRTLLVRAVATSVSETVFLSSAVCLCKTLHRNVYSKLARKNCTDARCIMPLRDAGMQRTCQNLRHLKEVGRVRTPEYAQSQLRCF